MTHTLKRGLWAVALVLSLSGCGYNDFQRLDEQTTSAWAEVLNQYQRRADLVPNLWKPAPKQRRCKSPPKP
jgi:LemA protein